MTAYLVRKLLNTIPIIFGVALLVFILLNVVGGDPTYQIVGRHASPAQIAEVRHRYHFDDSLPVQFFRYLGEIVTFDYGESTATHQSISGMIWEGLGPTLTLAIPAFIATSLISVLIALFSAYFRGKWVDRWIMFGCVIGMSLPSLAYILFGQYFLAYKWGLFPISGFEPGWPERFIFVLMPAAIWVAVSVGYDVRFVRTAILEESNQDFVRTARAKGLSEPRVFLKHVLKASMVPIITNFVIEIPLLVLGAFLLESFFGIPGIGKLTIDAVNNSDFPVIKAMTTLTSLLMIFGNLVTDVLYLLVDPRVSFK